MVQTLQEGNSIGVWCLKQWLLMAWIGSNRIINPPTRVYAFFRDKRVNFVKCAIISVFRYVFFLVQKLVIPPFLLCLVYYRDQKHLPWGIPIGGCSEGMQWILGEAPMQTYDFRVVASRFWLNSNVSVGVFLRVCCVPLEHLSVGLRLGDCFC